MYVVIPRVIGFGLFGIAWLMPSLVQAIVEVCISLVSLIFAGAIARYYLRNTLAAPVHIDQLNC